MSSIPESVSTGALPKLPVAGAFSASAWAPTLVSSLARSCLNNRKGFAPGFTARGFFLPPD